MASFGVVMATIFSKLYGDIKLDYRMRKLDLDIKFLNVCQNNDLCPTFVQYKISSTPLQNSNAYQQSQHFIYTGRTDIQKF